MMEVIDGQGRLPCSDARLLLEKTVAEEILSDREQHLLDAHLTECGRCRGLHKLTFGLSLFAEAADGELDARISAVTEGLRREREAAKRRRTWWAAAGVAAAVLAVIAVGRWSTREPAGQEGRTAVAFQCAAGALSAPAEGVWMSHCEGSAPKTVVGDDGAVRVVLKEGAVALYVNPDRPNKKGVEVETPIGTVRVKGTLFAVHVDNDDAHVQVYRGVVDVLPPSDETYSVSAGRGSAFKHRTTYACAAPSDNALIQALSAHVPPNVPDAPEETSVAEGSVSELSPSADDAGALAVAETEIASDSGAPLRRERRHGVADNRRRSVTMDELIQDAQSCLLLRDWNCAASRYREVLGRYSRRPESAAVLISLAKVELRHLRLPGKALGHYREYLSRLPGGPLAEEALLGIAEAYRRMGQEARERETLQSFLQRFPQSTLSGKARSRLNQLNNTSSL